MSFSRFLTLAMAASALAGCADHDTTSPTGSPSYLRIAGDPPPDPPYISSGSVSSSPLVINGAAGSYSVTVENPGPGMSLVSLVSRIVQGGNQRSLESHSIHCGASSSLPSGSCTDGGSFVVSNDSSGWGTIVPGSALVHVELRQAATLLAQFDIPVTLVSLPKIAASSLAAGTSLVIGGANSLFNVTIANGGPAYSNVILQNYIVQGSTRLPANGRIACDPTGGIPAGGAGGSLTTCVVPMSISADARFVPGFATAEVDLIINGVVVDVCTRWINLTLP